MKKIILVAAAMAALATGCSRTPDPLSSIDGACANYFKSKIRQGVILAVDDASSGDHCSALITYDTGRSIMVAEASGVITRYSEDKFTVLLEDNLRTQSYFSASEMSEDLKSVAWSEWLKTPTFAGCEESWTKIAEGKERLDRDIKCHNAPESVMQRLFVGNQKRLSDVAPMTTAKACEQLGKTLIVSDTIYASVKQDGDESCSAVTIESSKKTPNNAIEKQLTFNIKRLDPETVEIERDDRGSRAFTIISETPYLFDQRIPSNFSVDEISQNLNQLNPASDAMTHIKDAYQATFFPDPNPANNGYPIDEYVVNFAQPALSYIRNSNIETMTMLSQLPPGLLDNNLAKRWLKLIPTLKQEASVILGAERPDLALKQVGHDRFNKLMSIFEECVKIENELKDKVENRVIYKIQADKGPLKGQMPHKQVITGSTDITNT